MSTGAECKEGLEQGRREFVPKTGPIVGAMTAIGGWLTFILLYALYWSRSFDLYQSVIVTIASLGLAVLLICGLLLVWYRPNGKLRRK
jgi:uncharacterized iron-regulated membrane protein